MTVPPGWYPDPAPGSSLQRFWDGSTWTQETRPVGQAEPSPAPAPDVPSVEPSTEPSAAAAPEPVEGEEGPSRRGRRRRSARAPEPAEDAPSRRARRRRAARLSYGWALATPVMLLVWLAAAAAALFAPSLVGWSETTLFPPLFWIP